MKPEDFKNKQIFIEPFTLIDFLYKNLLECKPF